MIDSGEQGEIHLNVERLFGDEETMSIAVVVAKHAEKRRADYRRTEKSIKHGLLDMEIFWSDTVPWYEWMSEPQILQSCAEECGLKIWQLADVIAHQIRPKNWQIFSWIYVALQGHEYEEMIAADVSRYVSTLAAERKQRRDNAAEAGRASGVVRAESARCTPETVALAYKDLMANGREKREIASVLAIRYNVTSDHIRKQFKKANTIKPSSRRD